MKRPVRFIVLILGLSVVLSASAQIYQWKDKDGRTHFSDQPPANQPGVQVQTHKTQPPATRPNAGEGNTEPAAATPVPARVPARQRDEEFRKRRDAAAEAEREAARAEQREQDCQRARTQYAVLNSGQRIAWATEDGGRKILDDEERAAETARVEELIGTLCGKD